MKKKILIFGITGQDGSHLAKLYVKKKMYSTWNFKKKTRKL